MSPIPHPAIVGAAEVRRRDLPVSIALLLFVGGIGAAVLSSSLAVAWAGVLALMLIADLYWHRRSEKLALSAPVQRQHGAWNFVLALAFAALPLALWIDGAPAAMAAALALWVVGLLRPFAADFSLTRSLALASAAPSAVCLAIAPVAVALGSARADWDAAALASMAGICLVVVAVRAGVTGMTERAQAGAHNRATAAMVDQLKDALGAERVQFIDISGRLCAGASQIAPTIVEAWSDVVVAMSEGQRYYRDGWEARPWRSPEGDLVGAMLIERGAPTATLNPRDASVKMYTAMRA